MARSTVGAQWVIGWREWLALPDLGVDRIKAKVDTGARTSSLHVDDLEFFQKGRERWARFAVHPLQRSRRVEVFAEAAVLEERGVRNSGGAVEVRPVIRTTAALPGRLWTVELTLTNRDQMGFRMLLGRQALRRRFLIDPAHSFLAGEPEHPRAQAAES
jgi:hypothetical protein